MTSWGRKRPKYGNTKVEVEGILFDSKWEARCWADLLLRQRAGDIGHLERQVRVPLLAINGQIVCHMILDFRWRELDGTVVWADSKGFVTESWNIKRKWFEAQEGKKIIMLRDSKRGKR